MVIEKHLIFVQSYYFPDHSAGSQMLTDLSFYLVNKGFRVSIISSRKIYGSEKNSLLKYEEINKVNVFRKYSFNFGRKTLIGRFLDYISLEISMLIGIFNQTRRGAIVIFMTDPPLLNIIASSLITRRGGLIVNWLQDLFPEVAVGAGLISHSSILNKSLTNIRNKALNKANKNIVIGNSMLNYLIDIGIESDKIIGISNWADGNKIKSIPNDENYIRQKWGLDDNFVVGYSGNLGKAHNISTILKVIDKLKNDNYIKFLFIGGGIGMNIIKKYSQDKQLKNVIFKPYQPRHLLHLTLSVADVHWITLEPQMESFILPSKIYGILAAAKPIIFIGDKNGEIAKMIGKIDCGKTIEIGDSDIFIETIIMFSKDIKLLNEMGQRGRLEFKQNYDFQVSAKKFLILFNDLMSSTNVKNFLHKS
jgi:colanic acid biosynthesis glycosyl transferase WcaI